MGEMPEKPSQHILVWTRSPSPVPLQPPKRFLPTLASSLLPQSLAESLLSLCSQTAMSTLQFNKPPGLCSSTTDSAAVLEVGYLSTNLCTTSLWKKLLLLL